MTASTVRAWDALDSAWFYPGRERGDGFAIAVLSLPEGAAAPLFTSAAMASTLLSRAEPGTELLEIPAADWRAKEEWLRAAIAQECAIVAADLDARSLEPAATLDLELALGYVLSQKRATACL